MNAREKVGFGISNIHDVLEIGALNNPIAKKGDCNVTYVDYTTTEDLKERFKDISWIDPQDLVNVDAVWGEQTLQECIGHEKTVDFVIASHVIEHVPDLITWLQELRSVLKTGGEIRLIIPDKRFTFDCARSNTQLPELIDAYLRRARRPLPHLVADFYFHYRDVNLAQVWAGEQDTRTLPPANPPKLAIEHTKTVLESDHYDDIHCWVFTPHSFARLMRSISDAGIVTFECSSFQDTQHNTFEFTVFIRPSNDPKTAARSWAEVESVTARELPIKPQKLAAVEIGSPGVEPLVEELRGNLQNARQSLAEKETQLTEAKKSIEAIRASTSWKITAPLRYVASMLRR